MSKGKKIRSRLPRTRSSASTEGRFGKTVLIHSSLSFKSPEFDASPHALSTPISLSASPVWSSDGVIKKCDGIGNK
jgi:hypothetical protein